MGAGGSELAAAQGAAEEVNATGAASSSTTPAQPAGLNAADFAICLAFSGLSGVGVGFFGCVLAASDRLRKENGNQHTPRSRLGVTVGAIGSTVFGLGSLVGLYFGPVTFVTMARTGTTLPANVLFSQVFKLRPLGRDDHLGTVITISSAICFMIFCGPPGGDLTKEAFEAVTARVAAISLLGSFFLVWAASLCYIVVLRANSKVIVKRASTAVVVSLMTGCSSAFMDISTKGWSACLRSASGPLDLITQGGWLFWVSAVANIFFMVFLRLGLIWGCQHCDVLLFVPLNAVLNTFTSVTAGFVALAEASAVVSWPGLFFSGISCATGTLLLAGGGPAEEVDSLATPASNADEEDDDDGGDRPRAKGPPMDVPEGSTSLGLMSNVKSTGLGLMSNAQGAHIIATMNTELHSKWRRKAQLKALVERITSRGRNRGSNADGAANEGSSVDLSSDESSTDDALGSRRCSNSCW